MEYVTLRLELPRLAADMPQARIDRWHKVIGDRVEYGDDLFDVVVEEVTRLRRSGTARNSTRERRGRVKFRTLAGTHVRFRISSLDTGTLIHVEAGPQTTVSEGVLVGYLNETGREIDGAGAGHLAARLVVNRVESEFSEAET